MNDPLNQFKSSVIIEEIVEDEEPENQQATQKDAVEEPKVWNWPVPTVRVEPGLVDFTTCQFNLHISIKNEELFHHNFEVFDSKRKTLLKEIIEDYELELNKTVTLSYENIKGVHGDTITFILHSIAPDGQDKITLIGKEVLPCYQPTPVLTLLASKTRNSLSYKWQKSESNGSEITGYSVYQSKEGYWYDNKGEEDIEFECIASNISATHFKATKLLPGRYYYVYTTVTNAIGTTKGSIHCYRTQSTIPLVPSFEMDNIVVHDTTIDLVWKALNYEDCCGLDLKNYILQMDNCTGKGFWNIYVGTDNHFTVENLIPKHQYLFRILAETIEGKSNYSSPLTLSTEQCVCPGIENIQLSKNSSSSLFFYWSVEKSHEKEVDEFKIHFHDPSGVVEDGHYQTNNLYFTIEHLLPALEYELSICAHTKKGWGPYGRTVVLKTLPAAPEAPELCVSSAEGTAVHLIIKEKHNNGAPVLDYSIEAIQVCRQVQKDQEGVCCACDVHKHPDYYLSPSEDHPVIEEEQKKSILVGQEYFYIKEENEFVPCLVHGQIDETTYRILLFSSPSSFLYTTADKLVSRSSFALCSTIEVNQNKNKYTIPSADPYGQLTIHPELHSKCCSEEFKDGSVPYVPLVTLKKKDLSYDEATNSFSYTVSDLIPDTSYFFRVRALNERGWSKYSTAVRGTTSPVSPEAPPALTLSASKINSLELSVVLPSSYHSRGSHILNYIIEKNSLARSSDVTTLYECVYDGPSPSVTISNLLAGHAYKFRCALETDCGFSPYSEVVCFTTQTTVPDPISSISSVPLLQYMNPLTNYHIQWEPPKNDGGMPITSYGVYLTKDKNTSLVYRGMETDYLLSNLLPGNTYKLRVQSSNANGNSVMSSYYTFSTGSSVPSKMDAPLLSEHATSSTISIQWIPPTSNGSMIANYEVLVEPGSKRYLLKPNNTSFSIQKLKPNTQYSIQICATNQIGMGEWSDPLVVRTEEQSAIVPYISKPLTATVSGEEGKEVIHVHWSPAENRGAEVLQYIVLTVL